jgi:hypothetical protein
VPVLDLGQPPIQIALPFIRLGARQKAVQIRGIRLILPMVLECVQVGTNRSAHDRKLGRDAVDAIAVRAPVNPFRALRD